MNEVGVWLCLCIYIVLIIWLMVMLIKAEEYFRVNKDINTTLTGNLSTYE